MYANLPRRRGVHEMIMATNDAKGTLLSGYCHNLSCSVH